MSAFAHAAIFLFPAQAGVIPQLHYVKKDKGAVPRASGGDPCCRMSYAAALPCSPRKRG